MSISSSDMNQIQTGGGSTFSSVMLILYILLKYPIKYMILFWLFSLIMMFFNLARPWGCKAWKQFMKFFKKITNIKNLDLILLKIPNIFTIFIAFIDLLIGGIYFCVCVMILLGSTLVTIPFNYIIAW